MPPTSPIPGPFNPDFNPYMKPVVAAFADPQYNRVTFVMGTQMGKSVSMENLVGWRLDDDPTPIMYVAPTSNLIDSTVEPKFMDMFEQAESLSRKYDWKRSTKYTKWVGGTKFRFAWAGSPTELAADSAGLVLVDEVDRIVNTGEGDTTEIIEARGDAYVDSKIGYTATPTDGKVDRYTHPDTGWSHWSPGKAEAIGSAIWKLWQSGTRHEWAVPCPHCGEYFIPHSDLLWWPGRGSADECTPDQAEKQAMLTCPSSGCLIEDRHRPGMNQRAVPVAPGQHVTPDGVVVGDADTAGSSHFSLWVSGLCSFAAKKSYGFLAKKLLGAIRSGDPAKLQAVYNTGFGECYAVTGEAPAWEEVYQLRDAYSSGELPDPRVHTLICTVDVQKNRLVYAVRGWMDGMGSRLIEADELWGDTDKPEVWTLLDELMDRRWGGKQLKLCGVDCGYRTDEVLAWVRRHRGRARALMGFERLPKPLRMMRLEIGQQGKVRKRGDKRWDFDASLAKAWVHGRIRWARGQAGDWLLPADVSEDYCRQIVAEEFNDETGKWSRVSKDNHFLDCEGMQYMCARMLRLDRRKQQEQSAPDESQSDEVVEPVEVEAEENQPKKTRKTVRRKRRKPKAGFVSRYR
ncbi:terminase gpA endonuclease subunit [Marinobacterium jannaschii]|uniref:terminase gpA endonuclease subunit n=1 Tax=Marinobacterium jannaschii TaxID=64970 RepID=UPI001B806420|nr:terminase gpA endonuclease subunit [Marinobacterium jannaschii]